MDPRKISDSFSSEKITTIKSELNKVLKTINVLENQQKIAAEEMVEKKLVELSQRSGQILDEKFSELKEEFHGKIMGILNDFEEKSRKGAKEVKHIIRGDIKNEDNQKELFVEKVHVKQSAPISKLLYSKDFQTIYNIFIAILLNFGIAELAKDLLDSTDVLGLNLLAGNFGNIEKVIMMWIAMFVWSFIPVTLVQLVSGGLSIYLGFFLHALSVISIFLYGCHFTQEYQLPIASSIVALSETVRFIMKMHSYFREKLLHGNGYNKYSHYLPSYAESIGYSEKDLVIPQINIKDFAKELKRYTFFLFVPTLIYRDSYPKIDKSIRWKNLGVHVFDFFGSIVYTTLIFKAFCVPTFKEAANNLKDPSKLIISWIVSMLPGTFVFLLLFFAVMHSWFSIWAEILNFADRKFYDDWWNSSDFGTFYRKVSVILYEWMHCYVFIDLMRFSNEFIGQKLARYTVYLLGGICCELVIDLSLGFFSPFLFILISGPGLYMISMKAKTSRLYNVLVWAMLIIVNGLIIMLYSLEYYSRLQNSYIDPFPKYGLLGYLIPQWSLKMSLISIN
ncbi:unnamed protein product [Blepharisma stoltei]|uniref:O-acyltransferase n=1 Tax=Blepharisma stoltei TaxID=1481888 RepID=A0AAU9JSR5_9CILI|nr:unnamed protein product [Blepharisma stoltei]